MSIAAMKQAIDCLQCAYNLQQIDDLIPPHAPVKQTLDALHKAIEQAEKREWVGLTDEEIDKCCDFPLNALGMKNVRKIEAKLRSKNT